MKRILIIGCSGAGKTTLALQMADRLQLELIHLDKHYWHAGWVESNKADWQATATAFAERPEWVMDGNYGGTMDLRLQYADTAIFLDFSTWRCLWRVIKRTVRYYGTSRPDMAEGCHERWDWSFLRYVAVYRSTRRAGVLERLQRHQAHLDIHILPNPVAVQQFLTSLPSPSK
ncbi:MAG: hypothetical protein AAF399_17410 [Bacteroidota bacterium]